MQDLTKNFKSPSQFPGASFFLVYYWHWINPVKARNPNRRRGPCRVQSKSEKMESKLIREFVEQTAHLLLFFANQIVSALSLHPSQRNSISISIWLPIPSFIG